jgi:subtilisin-like proprotein convertase family protein
VDHGFVGDLRISLSHAERTVVVWNREGGRRDGIHQTFNVLGFEGMNSAGEWVLGLTDEVMEDEGQLTRWSIAIMAQPIVDPMVFPSNAVVPIPDAQPGGITTFVNVPSGTTGAVQIAVRIDHSHSGDLAIALHGAGRTWTLSDREEGDADGVLRVFELEDPPTGDLGGSWALQVSDLVEEDEGVLQSWSVIVHP